MRFGSLRVYAVPWWDVDHHAYGCPITVSVHSRTWFFSIRPFSNFAQGGDRRGRTDLHDYERTCRWVLGDQRKMTWDHLEFESRHLKRRYCVWCLHDQVACPMLGRCKERPEWLVDHPFLRHLWAVHVKRRERCRIRWKDTEEVELD